MITTSGDNHLVRLVTTYTSVTCLYVSAFLFALFYSRNLYNIGKRNCLPFISGLVVAECLKLSLSRFVQNTTNIRDKTNKTKKFYFKSKCKGILVILTMIVLYYAIAVLFGAPFLSEQEETLMFSLLITALTVVPACLHLGADATVLLFTGLTTYQGDLIVEMVKNTICFTLFGAWLGAIVIPLDWDRPWQVWPIPCSLGAIVGNIFSQIVILVRLMPKFASFFVKRTGKYGL